MLTNQHQERHPESAICAHLAAHGRLTAAEGTGLGLPITKAIVTAHRGQVVVTSEAGVTRFVLVFPG